jgi:hypothetical protein
VDIDANVLLWPGILDQELARHAATAAAKIEDRTIEVRRNIRENEGASVGKRKKRVVVTDESPKLRRRQGRFDRGFPELCGEAIAVRGARRTAWNIWH